MHEYTFQVSEGRDIQVFFGKKFFDSSVRFCPKCVTYMRGNYASPHNGSVGVILGCNVVEFDRCGEQVFVRSTRRILCVHIETSHGYQRIENPATDKEQDEAAMAAQEEMLAWMDKEDWTMAPA